MTVSEHCLNSRLQPKERFASIHAAHAALARKRKFRNRRYPRVYWCIDCAGFHLTSHVA